MAPTAVAEEKEKGATMAVVMEPAKVWKTHRRMASHLTVDGDEAAAEAAGASEKLGSGVARGSPPSCGGVLCWQGALPRNRLPRPGGMQRSEMMLCCPCPSYRGLGRTVSLFHTVSEAGSAASLNCGRRHIACWPR